MLNQLHVQVPSPPLPWQFLMQNLSQVLAHWREEYLKSTLVLETKSFGGVAGRDTAWYFV